MPGRVMVPQLPALAQERFSTVGLLGDGAFLEPLTTEEQVLITRLSSLPPQEGHLISTNSPEVMAKCSNTLWQDSQRNSKMGMVSLPGAWFHH